VVQGRDRGVPEGADARTGAAAVDTSPGPLFTTRSGNRLDRTLAFVILRRIARQANAHLPPEEHLQVSTHVLRHTLLRKVANEKGVHYAMELSGHRSDRYIWRYVRPDEQSLADTMDELE
jgi:hypothetical protein